VTRDLRLIGWWDGPEAGDGWPCVCGFISDDAPDEKVIAYLRSGTAWVACAGFSRCRLCGRDNGSVELTDGENFCWPEGLAHYVEEHGIRLPAEVAAVAARGPAGPVDLRWFQDAVLDSDALAIDEGWWQSLGRETAEHRPGCRHHPARCSWDLPRCADIHVGGVPIGDVALMARLRRLLGAGWPFAELRAMTADQPFLGVTGGDPAALNRVAELRDYLFYATPDGLLPVATDV
jgi:hypothetical protein